MAAGFDKNAEIFSSLFNFGFGFVEVGTVTPQPQTGNPMPRLFRLKEDLAIINRFGFNNCGADLFLSNIEKSRKIAKKFSIKSQPLGINIGKNKNSEADKDYDVLIKKFYGEADYITINISSPNTKNLRDLQNPSQLREFLGKVLQIRKNIETPKLGEITKEKTAILLKIAPDLDFDLQQEIAKIVNEFYQAAAIDGLIISNTTIRRDFPLKSKNRQEIGGLSGKPLFEISNQILKNFSIQTNGQIPIIAAGGISSGLDAFEKICFGATLVQIYSSLIYQGFGLVEKIKAELNELLTQKGFKSISAAIGSKI